MSRSAGTTPRRTRTSPRYSWGSLMTAYSIRSMVRGAGGGAPPPEAGTARGLRAGAGGGGVGAGGGAGGRGGGLLGCCAAAPELGHRDGDAGLVHLRRLGPGPLLDADPLLLLDNRLADVLDEPVGAPVVLGG